VIVVGDHGYEGLCITDESRPLFKTMFGAVTSTASVSRPLGEHEIVATSLGSGSMNGHSLSVAAGRAGEDIAGISYQSAGHGTIRATVTDGRFAFWFPGSELEGAVTGIDVDVSYTDGTRDTVRIAL
jgi:hypothetical protein